MEWVAPMSRGSSQLIASSVLVNPLTIPVALKTALVEAMRESIPSYRTQHIAANEQALRAGLDAVEAGAFPAWAPVAASAANQ